MRWEGESSDHARPGARVLAPACVGTHVPKAIRSPALGLSSWRAPEVRLTAPSYLEDAGSGRWGIAATPMVKGEEVQARPWEHGECAGRAEGSLLAGASVSY